ncbi:hypothetical protein RJ640_008194 [Escallonia rubra]|uniref:Reverse transcriptase Ty1/copia-type domain-containing protein n=1 Tax=Escallonia rubra TaxID=112253 RepID=A0AA88QN46_9ASTE|nr:hypothetical protein RJ640_008194 [Escallonia rubra]
MAFRFWFPEKLFGLNPHSKINHAMSYINLPSVKLSITSLKKVERVRDSSLQMQGGRGFGASGGVTALLVYVDDIIVTRNDSDEKEALHKYLAKEFKIKDLRKLKHFLGIEVARSKEGIFVSQ